MPDNTVQQIKDRLDIVEVVGGYLKLEKTGINLRANCPFHQEKKPSFFVSPTRQTFKCFGCSVGGDVFEFVKRIEGIEFGDALRLLAKRAGVKLPQFQPELQTKRQRLYQICGLACAFFEKQLQENVQGKKAGDYLLNRGLKLETIKKWRLGYSPDTWQALSDFLVGRGFTREEVVEAGLAVKPEKQGNIPYDRFRGRIIFPVFDLHNQVVGFGGRVFGQEKEAETAKYLNTPNTLLYDKSRTVFGLNFAKLEARQKNFIILTEGYLDVILSQQAGFLNTVASSGTSLTAEQLNIIQRYTNNLLTGFDMDKAGDLATQRGIDLALARDFQVKVISMPQGKDPADIASQSPAQWQELVEKAQEIMDFYFTTACLKFSQQSPEGKKEMAQFLLPKIKQISNSIIQSHWLQKLANTIRVSEEAVSSELKKLKPSKQRAALASRLSPGPNLASKPKSRRSMLEERLLSLCWQSPQCLSELAHQIIENCSEPVREILFTWQKQKPSQRVDLEPCLAKLADKGEKYKALLDDCLFMAENSLEEKPAEEVRLCCSALEQLSFQDKLAWLSSQISEAEARGEQKKLQRLMEQFNQLSRQNYVKEN